MSPEERRDHLKALIVDAVNASAQVVRDHIAADAYVPTHFSDYPSEVKNWDKSLMPRVDKLPMLSGPKDYSRIFVHDPEKHQVKTVAYGAVDELVRLKE